MVGVEESLIMSLPNTKHEKHVADTSQDVSQSTVNHTDEGYVEQPFQAPDFMSQWTDEQKAEFAYQLLLTVPTPRSLSIINRLTPLLRCDFLSLLPYELAMHILSFLDVVTLTRVACVSRRWRKLSSDQSLWRELFRQRGWEYDEAAMTSYLSSSVRPRGILDKGSTSRSLLAPVPLARTTAPMYDPAALTSISGSPQPLSSLSSSRLHPFKRTGDIFLRLRQRRGAPLTDGSEFDMMNPAHASPETNDPPHIDTLLKSPSLSSSSSSSLIEAPQPSTSALPPTPFPRPLSLAAPSSHSRSQPLSPSLRSPANRHSARVSMSSCTSHPLSIIPSESEPRYLLNRPTPRRHVRHDETALYHYCETTDERFINWRRLYQNRNLIEKRWREGKCKVRCFPPARYLPDMHFEGIYCIQFDDEMLVSGSRDRTIKVWDMRTGKCRRTLEGHAASVLCLQYDSRYIISGSSDFTIIQWDTQTWRIIRTLRGHGESVLNLRFSHDRIVSCSKDQTIRVWDLNTGRTLRILRGHRAAVNAIQFKDNRVVSASGDRTIKLWDMDSGECLRTFDSHSRGIACVEFDGTRIVSGSSDQTIKIWNAETGECLLTLTGHTDLVRTLQMNPQTRRIVSGGYDGCVKIWQFDDENGELMRFLPSKIEGRILNLQFDFARIVCCTNLAKIVVLNFAHGIDTQFLL